MTLTSTPTPSPTPVPADIDGNGPSDALTDGVLLLRFLFGFQGSPLTEGALDSGCTRCSPQSVEEFLLPRESLYDADGNGETVALSDGILFLRYLFGFRDEALIMNAVAQDCTRCTAEEIESYLAGLVG